MKLNIWQWLGVVMLVLAIGFWVNRQFMEHKQADAAKGVPVKDYADDEPTSTPTSAPASAPATAPA
jgi:hypothetical protein